MRNSTHNLKETEQMKKMWVCGFEGNPNSPEYGKLVLPKANLYSSAEIGAVNRLGEGIPHGEQVEVLEIIRDEWVCRVRYHGVEDYVQTTVLVDYDPADGVRPHPLHRLD